MKKFIASVVVFFGTSAFACPDLAGTYMCPSYDGGIEETVVSQIVRADGVTIYDFATQDDSFTWPADGVLTSYTFKDDDSGSDYTVSFSLTCSGNTLLDYTFVKEIDTTGNETIMEIDEVVSKDAAGNLSYDTTYRYNGSQTHHEQRVCTKK